MGIQVKDFMSTPVVTAWEEDSVEEIRDLMKERAIHAIPIISKESTEAEVIIRGIVTATDINAQIDSNAEVKSVMSSSSVHVVHTTSSANAAAKMMIRHNVHHIVVMDEGKIEGMISSIDFVKLVSENTFNS